MIKLGLRFDENGSTIFCRYSSRRILILRLSIAMMPRLSSSLSVRIAVFDETPAISASSARETLLARRIRSLGQLVLERLQLLGQLLVQAEDGLRMPFEEVEEVSPLD